jgi:signal transduction histidine kinase
LQALGSTLPVPAMLFTNPALLLRGLDAVHRTTAFAPSAPLSARIGALDSDWLESLIRRSALHVALQDPPSNHAFLLRHWYLSRRLSLLAAGLAQATSYPDVDSAACCGALLRAGMLVLEQQQSVAYAVPTAGSWQQQVQLATEHKLFQLDHVEAGVRLLEGWELDQFSVDALRYQAEPLAQVLDAAPLVKICWYANTLADSATTAALRAGHDLLGLGAEQVQALLERVQRALDNECAALGVSELRSVVGNGDLAHEAQQKLQQLRQEISIANMLAPYTDGKSDATPDVQLARLLQDAGIDPAFIVFDFADEQVLNVRFSHRVQPDPAGLTLVCAAGRNAVSALILKGEAGVLTADTGLTVVDRQLLTLLGGQTVLCEPLRDGDRAVVLLLGMNASAVTSYLAQNTLRQFIARLLLAPRASAGDDSASTVLLQQRVREAVHEANNPLAIIKNYLYILGMKQGGGQIPEELQLVRSEIDRIAAILGNLRQPVTNAPQKISLNKVVSSMHRLFAESFKVENKSIAIELQLAPEEPQVVASDNALKQILINLVKNAAEAIVGSGTITLGTRTRIYLNDRFYAQISVRDDGPGIAPDLMLRLFKPGASTKGGAHAGSGLGIVRRLVEELGGQIGCRSDDKGTAMEILIPLTE